MTTAAPVSAERLAAAARAQTDIPGARVFGLRRAWEERLRDLWGVTVEGRAAGATRSSASPTAASPFPPASIHAARELSELRPLDGQPWGGGLIYIVTAAGGATPGFRIAGTRTRRRGRTGRAHDRADAVWVAYAAAGGVRPAPRPRPGRPAGRDAARRMATASLDLAADSSLQWRYQLAGRESTVPRARRRTPRRRWATTRWSPRSTAPGCGPPRRGRCRCASRRRCRSPDVLIVELWALGPVYVASEGTAPSVDWAAPPSELVPLLSAADRLPPGILPQDLLTTAEVAGGELAASLPAPLAEWAAGGARQRSPRVAGVRSDADMAREGRVRIRLDGASDWALEVADGAGWSAARGDIP